MKRFDQIVTYDLKSQYGALTYFSERLHEAFVSLGVDSKVIQWFTDNSDPTLKEIVERQPYCTLSFNCVPFLETNNVSFCDELLIPHVAILMDAPYFFIQCWKTPNLIMTCFERSSVNFYRQMGYDDIFFLPHAADSKISYDPRADRPYDVTVLATCIDYVAKREEWKLKYSSVLQKVMDLAIALCEAHREIHCYQAFIMALDEWEKRYGTVDPTTIKLPFVLSDIDLIVRGKHRVEMIKAVKSAEVHVFGCGVPGREWKKYLGGQSNVTIHDEVDFDGAIEIMKQSRVILNSTPTIRDGVHERLLSGLAAGAVVVSSQSDYVDEHFQDTGAVAAFKSGNDMRIDEAVRAYLGDERKRQEAAEKGRAVVLARHTWENRVEQLLETIPLIIEKRKQNGKQA